MQGGVYAASTVGEETTKSGAYWTSTRIRPNLAVVVDVTYTSDYEGMNPADAGTVLKTRMAKNDMPDIVAMGGDNNYTEVESAGMLVDLSSED